jgi:hypothetical protein
MADRGVIEVCSLAPRRPPAPSPLRAATARQLEILEWIRRHYREAGVPPSIREVAIGFGFRSTTALFYHFRSLERKGLLRQAVSRGARCWLPVVPEGACPCCGRK